VKERMIKSYRLMLDFYGMDLIEEATGSLAHSSNWEERYKNMNRWGLARASCLVNIKLT